MVHKLEKDLAQRENELQGIFVKLVASRQIEVFRMLASGSIAFGLGQRPSNSRLRDSRHRTRVYGIFVNYFEIWRETDRKGDYELDRSYLHLHKTHSEFEDEEIFALHCDLLTPLDDEAYLYKRGPHIHLPGDRYGFARSHIALCLHRLDSVCTDRAEFDEAFDGVLGMINDEFLSIIDT